MLLNVSKDEFIIGPSTTMNMFLLSNAIQNWIEEGDEIIATGRRIGENFYGGYSQYAKVSGESIIKKPDSIEAAVSSSFGEMQYFSVDTHTIYPPQLIFKWDDSTHTYQSSAKTSGELSVSLYKNQKEYNQNDVAMFRVHVRDKYPNRAFTTTSNYLSTGYFTTGSYYSIRDANTEEEVIPFDDNYTKMSADSNGMYFKVYMKGLQPERYYRVLFKHINNDGTTIYDNDYQYQSEILWR